MHENVYLHQGNPNLVDRTAQNFGIKIGKRRDLVREKARKATQQRIWQLKTELEQMQHLQSLISNQEEHYCPKCQQEATHQIIWGDAVCHNCGHLSLKLVGA